MSIFESLLGLRAPRVARPDRRRRSQQAACSVESLEGRQLLSHAAAVVHHAAAVKPAGLIQPPHHTPTLIFGPILSKTGTGYVAKVPRFYPQFAGPPVSELSISGLKASIDRGGMLKLTGIVTANQIPSSTTPGSPDLYYIFGINRGGAGRPGVFPGRPNITFDAVVQLAVTQTGLAASVTDLTNGNTTTLPADSVLLKQNAVQLLVPLSTLPSTGAANPAQYTVNFFTSTASYATTTPSNVAAFAPEFRNLGLKLDTGFVLPVSSSAPMRFA